MKSSGRDIDTPGFPLIILTTTSTSLTIEALYKMSRKELDEEDTRRNTEEIWETIDIDHDGEITKDEFIENALKSEFISAIFSNI